MSELCRLILTPTGLSVETGVPPARSHRWSGLSLSEDGIRGWVWRWSPADRSTDTGWPTRTLSTRPIYLTMLNSGPSCIDLLHPLSAASRLWWNYWIDMRSELLVNQTPLWRSCYLLVYLAEVRWTVNLLNKRVFISHVYCVIVQNRQLFHFH